MTHDDLGFVKVGEHSIAYRQAGTGAAVVLLHGFLCDSRCWRRQLDELSGDFRVVAWDAPGAGSSSDPPETFTTADYARSLAGFLDALGIQRAHVVGLSWGGILAQEFCRLYPDRLHRLVLADTYAGWKGSLPEAECRQRLETCLRDSIGPPGVLVAKLLPGMFTDRVSDQIRSELGAILSDFHSVGFRVMSRSSAEMDTRELLPTIAVPTLVLWGDDDRRSSLAVAEQLHSGIPSAELAVIAGAGHVSNMEQPAAFNAHVRRFCLGRDAT